MSESKSSNLGVAGTEDLAVEFRTLVRQWKEETFFQSSLSKLYAHPAYLKITAMGELGLPLVLCELRDRPDRWFHALKSMAHQDISAGIKDSDEARRAWLNWGHENGYI